MSNPLPSACMALDAERAVLGAALQDQDAARLVAGSLTVQDFYHDVNRHVFTSITDCVRRQVPADPVTVYRALVVQNLDTKVPATTIPDLIEAVPTTAHTGHYLRIVKQASVRRTLYGELQRVTEQLTHPQTNVQGVAADLAESLRTIAHGDPEADRVIAAESVADVLSRFLKQWDNGPTPTLSTPYDKLNHYLDGGFEAGHLIYLGARPGVGKTALALQLARYSAQHGTGTLIISREMVNTALLRRLLAQATRISASSLKRGTLEPNEWGILSNEYGRLRGLPLWFTDAATSLSEIAGLVDGWSAEERLGFMVVDYLQLVRGSKKERRFEVEEVSASLKTLALRHKIPVLCLSSLTRPVGGDQQARPTLASLKESGNLEHDADVILLMHRGFGESETEVAVAKNRSGRVGLFKLSFTADYLTFDTMAEE